MALRILFSLLLSSFLLAWISESSAKTKSRPAPRPEPELKIVQLSVSPNPYSPSQGPLNFAVQVELPKDLAGATMLEVSSLVSSPSQTSLRFLSNRQQVDAHLRSQSSNNGTGADGHSANDVRQRVSITLKWDGLDQNKRTTSVGSYHYEIRAKLLAAGEKGLRTQMTSWPKRGTVEVK